jgi:acyl carrier protein
VKRSEFMSQLAEFLYVDDSLMSEDAVLSDLGWDSLALLSVIGLVEEIWGLEVSEADLNACITVGDMLALFVDHLETN